ncbi:IS5 family transposase [Candidatus Tisiphia endosymbiont of Parasteatoda lunata]|uniref:IS5 family transposase n=2 Tax=Candidatus Tisiphia endosymbiont of Parasteatoda lunata TaxID=3066275 RepID=UPI00313DBD2D
MPIENIIKSQKQGKLFGYKLKEELNSNNKLYKLRELINWSGLEEWLSKNVSIKRFGRNRKCHRVMLGVTMLQAMYNFSDSLAEEELKENMYWQYFCGWEYIETDIAMSETSIRRFRNLLGESGYNEILAELIRVGIRTNTIKKKDLELIIADTTVQIKNIKHPHDVYLMDKARLSIVKLCQSLGISLNETYARTYKRDIIKLWKYKEHSKAKKRWKIMKHLKTLLGRLVRICEREIKNQKLNLSIRDQEVLKKVKQIHSQSVLKREEKKQYKEQNKILYSFHAPEVECIGKGKRNKPYEFGNKVAVVVSGRRNFVLSAKSFHNNPYDGHTLQQSFEAVENVTGIKIKKSFVDLGYTGSNVKEKSKVYTPTTRKKLLKEDKCMIRRRSAIEPIIGHLKQYGRMGRNFLKGVIGDVINPIISAIGLNLRCIANHLHIMPNST